MANSLLSVKALVNTGKYPFTRMQWLVMLRNRVKTGLNACLTKIGNRLYVDTVLFDRWLEGRKEAKNEEAPVSAERVSGGAYTQVTDDLAVIDNSYTHGYYHLVWGAKGKQSHVTIIADNIDEITEQLYILGWNVHQWKQLQKTLRDI